MKDRNMLSSIEFYTLKRYGYYISFNKQECGASLDYLSNVPSACILFRDENKALCRFSYILKKFVKKFFFYIIEGACLKWARFFFILVDAATIFIMLIIILSSSLYKKFHYFINIIA